MTQREQRMINLLKEALSPSYIRLTNDSARHAGHVGALGGVGDTHFKLEIAATQLDGLSRLAQHRLIQSVLHSEFQTGLHALEIKIARVSE